MNTNDFIKPVTAQSLNETLYKQFNVRINFDKYTREELENYRNLLRTKVHQAEQVANFNELLTDDIYQKDKSILDVLNARIKEMLGEAKLAEKAVSKAQQKFMGMVYAAKKGGKPASKEVAKVAKGMSKKAAKDYAETKHKGLPEKKKSDESVEEGTKMKKKPNDGNLANNAKPYDKVTRGDVIAGRLGKDEMGGKNKKVKEATTDESGLQAYLGNKKYGKDGMDALRKAGREGKDLRPIRAKYSKANEAAKPDYLDLDKDGNKKEPMKKAAKDMKKKKMSEGRMTPAERAHHHAMEYMKHHKAGNLEMAMHHRDACEECGGMIQHGPMGECWHMHSGMNKGTPYKVGMDEVMTMEGQRKFKDKVAMISESIAYYIAEDEEGKAKTITGGIDMVNDFTTWMQRIGNYQTKTTIELADQIRSNFGVQDSERFKSEVVPALDSALAALTQAREVISNSVSILAGEAPAEEPMGHEPNDMDMNAGPEAGGMEMGGEDEFMAADAAAGGPETAGRMKRESIERGNRLMRILGS